MARPHPKEMIGAAAAEFGEDAVVDWCIALLTGEVTAEQAFSPELLPKLKWIGGEEVGGWAKLVAVNQYWVRVWAARALMYVWRDDAIPALLIAADDPAWRVREHVARVTAQRELGQLADALVPLLDHELPRVRATAVRALGAAGEYEHANALKPLRNDPDNTVRAAVDRALALLSQRLDRAL
ncbi:HEAT repeat domain-containing protein [Kribbella sp. NBC_01245]|uniref:HEAT repeat domain-containing protein n=1 Tax=Kribbella sp. NBC_01245 TaxID=2903578 RepID=UPI002E286BFB|nr:HEAT repeat domain-containing protein [Kribbella sp. NBC_01245]